MARGIRRTEKSSGMSTDNKRLRFGFGPTQLGKFRPLQNVITGVPLKISCFRIEGDSEAGSFTKYLPCKYQVGVSPVFETSSFFRTFRCLVSVGTRFCGFKLRLCLMLT